METRDPELKRLEEQHVTLSATQNEQQKRLDNLQSDREVLQDLAAPRTFDQGPQPESGPTQQPPDASASIAAQAQLARNQAQISEATAVLGKTQTALTANEAAQKDRATEIEQHKIEGKTNTTEVLTDKGVEFTDAVTYKLEQLPDTPDLPSIDVGGTGKHIGEAVAWGVIVADHLKTVGVRNALDGLANRAVDATESLNAKLREIQVPEPVNLSEKLQGLVDKFGSKEKKEEELADSQKLEKENDAHQKNLSQLNDLHGKISSQLEENDSQKNVDKLIDETQRVIKEQDKRRADSFDGNTASDPSAREQQFQNRVENMKEINAKRYETVNELLTPMAEANVLDKHFQTLEKEAENNKELLKMNEKRLKDQPDAEIKQKEYETKLNNDLAEKEKTLDARWQQDVQQELGGLRREHFPEVRTPTMDGPALAQSGPSQSGPGGSGGGSAMAPQQSGPGDGGAGGGAPQQQGPALQM